MLRFVVVSDTHGDRRSLQRVIDAQSEALLFVHLGDGAADMDAVKEFASIRTLQVAGNCDFSCPYPDSEEFRFGGKTFFATHGNLYRAKYTTELLADTARAHGAQAVLFGHTHQPLATYENGLHLINPGSLRMTGTYATIDIVGSELTATIVHL